MDIIKNKMCWKYLKSILIFRKFRIEILRKYLMSKLNHRGIHVCENNCWSICIEDFYKECMLEMNWWKDKIV